MRKLTVLLLLALLCACCVTTAWADGDDLVVNGDFKLLDDGGIPEGWEYTAWEKMEGMTELSITQEDGSALLFIENIGDNDARIEQTIDVEPNTIYRISCMARAQGCDKHHVGANVSVADSLALSNQAFDTGSAWQELVLWGRTGPKQRSMTVMLRLGGYGSLTTGSAWFSDVHVTATAVVPEGVVVQDLAPAPKGNNSGDGYSVSSIAQYLLIAAAFVLFFLFIRRNIEAAGLRDDAAQQRSALAWLLGGLVAAAFLRVLMAYSIAGYPTDMGCWQSWGSHMASVGPLRFYQEIFCDYPPGYIYVLGGLSGLASLLGLEGPALEALYKMPAILADLITAALLYRWMRKHGAGASAAACLALLYAFCPAIFGNSAAFGQIDSVFVVLLLVCIDQLMDRRMLPASLVYTVALLIKPQALMLGPVLLAAFLNIIAEDWRRGLMQLLTCVSCALVLFLALITPFSIGQQPLWIIEKYVGTLSSYGYASVSSYNLFTLLGGNWADQTGSFFFLTWELWGYILMAGVLGYTGLLWWKARDRWVALPLLGAVFVAGVFVFGVRMHERYLYPALPLLLLAYTRMRDKRLLALFVCLSIPQFINVMMVLDGIHLQAGDAWLTMLMSATNVVLAVLLGVVAWRVLVPRRATNWKALPETVLGDAPEIALEDGIDEIVENPAKAPEKPGFRDTLHLPTLDAPGDGRLRMGKLDWLWMLGITAVYAVMSLVNLGDTIAPETYWQSTQPGQTITFDLGDDVPIDHMQYYGGISHGDFTLEVSSDPEFTESQTFEIEYAVNTMFMWHRVPVGTTARYARLTFPLPGLRLHEVAFWDGGVLLPVADIQQQGFRTGTSYQVERLIDERDASPATPSYRNSMYFDEIYHARTAYEHINLMPWYETTHPPLGKVFISWSVMLFGMNPFGWRFAGALFGILMIPAMFLLGRFLFKKRWVVVGVTLLTAFDLMTYGQTRLATIDSYAVLFIIAMTLCMFIYMSRSFHHQSVWRTLVPLGLSGLFMGLGFASKWICVYSGIGLAILFFITLGRRIAEALAARRRLAAFEGPPEEEARLRRIVAHTPRNVAITLGAAVIFFIVIPALVYVASYYQYMQQGHGLRDIWQAQIDMFRYHSGLTEGHGFASPWYEWPLMIRPMWYYMGQYLPSGMVASLNGMGNPLVWGAGLGAIIWVIALVVKRKATPMMAMLLIALGAQFLPWTLVTRATFIYHYFASVPFLILCLGYAMDYRLDLNPRRGRREVAGYLAAVVAVFILFFPMVSGIPVPIEYARTLRWLPSWSLFSGS